MPVAAAKSRIVKDASRTLSMVEKQRLGDSLLMQSRNCALRLEPRGLWRVARHASVGGKFKGIVDG